MQKMFVISLLLVFWKEMDKKIVIIFSFEGILSPVWNLSTFVDYHFSGIQKYLLLRTILFNLTDLFLMAKILKS